MMSSVLRILAALFFAALSVCLLLAIHFTAITPNNYLWREIKNFGHAPLFGIIALCLFAAFVNLPGLRSLRRTTIYIVTLVVALLLAVASEWAQLYGPRDADLWDLARDVAGAVCGLALLATVDGRLLEQEPWKRQGFRRRVRYAAIALLLVLFIPVANWVALYIQRSVQMPMLMKFESHRELRWVEENGAAIELSPPPEGWAEMTRERVGKVTFSPGRFPGLIFREPYPDWTAYSRFSLDLYSEQDRPVDVVLRVDDAHANNWVGDRFNLKVTLQPGANRISFMLEEMKAAPETREMNLSAVGMMVLFAVRPDEPVSLYLADMKLE